jgi:hypothetical protein
VGLRLKSRFNFLDQEFHFGFGSSENRGLRSIGIQPDWCIGEGKS